MRERYYQKFNINITDLNNSQLLLENNNSKNINKDFKLCLAHDNLKLSNLKFIEICHKNNSNKLFRENNKEIDKLN